MKWVSHQGTNSLHLQLSIINPSLLSPYSLFFLPLLPLPQFSLCCLPGPHPYPLPNGYISPNPVLLLPYQIALSGGWGKTTVSQLNWPCKI